MVIMLSFLFFGCSNQQSLYAQKVSVYDKFVVNSQNIALKIPVGDNVHNVKVEFNSSKTTVASDIKHVLFASQKILSSMSLKTQKKCVNQIDKIKVYHVPCKVLNDADTRAWIDDNYIVKNTKVTLGLTTEEYNRDKSKFIVAYCFDEMVKLSTSISHNDDPYWRELALAHEMSHVWSGACEPAKSFFSPDEYERKAWDFHKGYKETAILHHIDY